MSLSIESLGDNLQFNSCRNFNTDEAMYETAGTPANNVLYYTNVKYLNEIKISH